MPPRNRLAYPAGRLPGFDLSHPAASNRPGFSTVVSGSMFINLLNAQTTLDAGAVTRTMDAALGPAMKFTASSSFVTFDGVLNRTGATGLTMAGIFRSTSAADTQTVIGLGNNFDNLFFYATDANTISFYDGSGHAFTGINIATNVPYFAVCSANTATINFVATNLLTGAIQTGVLTGAFSLRNTLSNNDVSLGSDATGGGSDSMGGNFAAGMVSLRFLSIPQLVQWAQDPWSFWYPQKTDFRSKIAVAAVAGGFIPAWAQNSNLPVIGTGNY